MKRKGGAAGLRKKNKKKMFINYIIMFYMYNSKNHQPTVQTTKCSPWVFLFSSLNNKVNMFI